MRRRRLIVLVVAVLAILGAYGFAVAAAGRVRGSAGQTADSYFRAWREGDVRGMARLVYQPPPDFVSRHLALTEDLDVEKIELRPGAAKAMGEGAAEVPFTGVRTLRAFGAWPFTGTLRLAVRDKAWKVLWSPETLHPLLAAGGKLEIVDLPEVKAEMLTSEGDPIPHDSYAGAYLDRLAPEFATTGGGRALVATAPGKPEQRLLTKATKPKTQRTTLSRPVQAAAARALDGVEDAAVVALRPSSGEVLAVADRLADGQSAFDSLYPPGSTFKTITAAALLGGGLDPAAELPCPGDYQIPFHRSFQNAGLQDHGTVTFADAFALSCNTTFVEQATTRLEPGELRTAAGEWGFGRALPTGVGGTCGTMEEPEDEDVLGADAIGQGTVQATPLCMAAVAAAVQSGTWRPPRLLPEKQARRVDGPQPEAVELDQGVVEALRGMMAAVVDHGTASQAGLPAGVAGKTGTAETPDGADHGWFIGYRDDLAFCVFVRHGGAGRTAALPIAARFLNGL
ncbi:cell division protein FtsI [Nonomuraea sp. SMC257]|uniref:Cell division protein FtsI n=1 Tax=Nonomuraea montanisoli TaxID=2741721 RepID=A0A7Y6IF10_9ACTN|nr:penicillin-binding transpeptidase domain-containing protein [Nonomuraea montanisoli]NUW36443.1 cell division protein FtsI [Nonomuraea montanisoli]